MDDFDDAMFSFALRNTYPHVLFVNRSSMEKSAKIDPAETIPECDQTVVEIWFPRDGWKPIFLPHPNIPGAHQCINPPDLIFYYTRTHWDFGGNHVDRNWAFDYPTPKRGSISSGRWEWDEEQREVRSKIIKALGGLSSNRLKSLLDRNEHLLMKDVSRRNLWVGYHVLDWCINDQRRAIDGHWRPCDDWTHKETDWLRSLKRQVFERFGQDYGGPREFVPRGKGSGIPHQIPN